jgi:CHRD domain-containing protein
MMRKLMGPVFGVALLLAGCGDDGDDTPDASDNPDSAAATTFDVTLTTAAEVPVCKAPGAAATGTATITISADNSTITVALTFSGLSGDATAAHIHSGAADAMGPPIFPFQNVTSPVNATFTAADYPSPAPTGAPADFAAAVTAMKAGMTYINVHTDACLGGEIRAQIE